MLRSLVGWWKKKRSYYVDIHQDLQQDATSVFPEEESLGTSQQQDYYDDIFDASSFHDTPSPPPISKQSSRSSPEPVPSTPRSSNVPTTPMMRRSTPNNRRSSTPRLLHSPPPIPEAHDIPPESALQIPFVRTSFSTGSLLSMDSLQDSYWDGDDDNDEILSHATPTASNGVTTDFFTEHVSFLRIQTKPRRVEVVWADEF